MHCSGLHLSVRVVVGICQRRHREITSIVKISDRKSRNLRLLFRLRTFLDLPTTDGPSIVLMEITLLELPWKRWYI